MAQGQLFVLLLFYSSITNAFTFHDTLEYLDAYGYIKTKQNELITINESSVKYLNALKAFQDYYKLPHDNLTQTIQLMKSPRCGVTDDLNYSTLSYAWNVTPITWDFVHGDSQLYNIAREAFTVWSEHVQLQFVRQPFHLNNKPNIMISFGTTRHYDYDKNGFCHTVHDGVGGVLAHAFSPRSSATRSVDIHLDYAENWNRDLSQTAGDSRTNLFEVLVHEIGHTLGIGHSQDNRAVMFPININKILKSIDEFNLSMDDINAIQSMYKPKVVNMSTSVPTSTVIPKHPDLCDLNNVTTFLIVDDNMFIFYEKWVWKKNLAEDLYKAIPYYLPTWLPFLPKSFKRVSAAYRRLNGNIVIIVNGIPYNIKWPSLTLDVSSNALYNKNINNIKGAVNTNTGCTYIFYDETQLMEIDECKFSTKSYSTLPKKIPGIPADIDGVFRYTNGRIYFFKKGAYYEYNEFLNIMTKAGTFSLSLFNINCPNIGVLQQLKYLVSKLISYKQ